MAQAAIARFPTLLPVSATPFSGGLTCGAVVTATAGPAGAALDWATAFVQWDGAALAAVNLSTKVPTVITLYNSGASEVLVLPDHMVVATGGVFGIPAYGTVQLTVSSAAFPLAFVGSTDVHIIAQMGPG